MAIYKTRSVTSTKGLSSLSIKTNAIILDEKMEGYELNDIKFTTVVTEIQKGIHPAILLHSAILIFKSQIL